MKRRRVVGAVSPVTANALPVVGASPARAVLSE
jgi:hypothetical protein